MLPNLLTSVVAALLVWNSAVMAEGEEEDDDVKGPLIKPKEGGGLWTTAEIIEQHGYKAETHKVVTKKGYELTAFRVLSKKQPPVGAVILQHGYLLSSDIYVSDVEALAFILANEGYCVWILNNRGNAYSRNHTTLSPKEKEFWNFSFHEMAVEDLPEVVDYIIKSTGFPKIHFIGHSLGATLGLILASHVPEYNEKLISLIILAPMVFLSKANEMIGPDGMIEEMAGDFLVKFKESGKKEVFPRKDTPKVPENQLTCEDTGESFKEMCSSKMSDVQEVLGGAYLPAGTSLNTVVHFFECGRAGQIRWFKYDTPEENKKAYDNSEVPPSYIDKFNKITTPVALWSTEMDQLLQSEDIDNLKSNITNLAKSVRITDVECFDHIAFMFPRQLGCISVRSKVYREIIETMKTLEKK